MRNLFSVRFIIVVVICVTLIGAPAVSVMAQTSSQAQQIEALLAILATIGNAIRTSTDLTEIQRLDFYTQLVAVSNAIVALQTSGTTETTASTTDGAILKRAILTYDHYIRKPTFVSAVMQIASSSDQTATFYYPELSNYTDFGQRMSAIRKFGSYDVGERFGIDFRDARRLIHVTGRNPGRDETFHLNSSHAYKLAEDFGTNTIITGVNIYPGVGEAVIKIESDKYETLTITIKENQEQQFPRKKISDGKKYSYQHVFRINDALRFHANDYIIIDYLLEDVEEEELLALLEDLFGKHPLSTEIADYDKKILQFLLENETYLYAVGGLVTSEDRECYDPADALVMIELASSLFVTMKVQHESVEDSFHLQAPVEYVDSSITFRNCVNVEKIF